MLTILIIWILGAYTVNPVYEIHNMDWMEICEKAHPIIVSEPCDELVDNNNELTSKGELVLLCLGGKTLAFITGQWELLGLQSIICSGSSDRGMVDNLLSELLK